MSFESIAIKSERAIEMCDEAIAILEPHLEEFSEFSEDFSLYQKAEHTAFKEIYKLKNDYPLHWSFDYVGIDPFDYDLRRALTVCRVLKAACVALGKAEITLNQAESMQLASVLNGSFMQRQQQQKQSAAEQMKTTPKQDELALMLKKLEAKAIPTVEAPKQEQPKPKVKVEEQDNLSVGDIMLIVGSMIALVAFFCVIV